MKRNILIRLNKILKDKLPDSFKDIEIEPHLSLQADLLIDSIVFYSLLMDIENAFDIQFKKVTMDADEYRTVGDLADYISILVKEGNN
ncbi:acyl carrier protein [Clostridium sporogenes]|uniref:acyl carrier protein n=1 Tax=Clostridium sporogenes TaxID=1509 RepID=UPI00223777A5|nr:acyl carrier protein [Clostridium sporogenes]MCW6109112.1 acyl carrier protein [Clostridium sporogenes]